MEGPWRAFRVQGPIVMTLIGVVAALANALADAGISIFAISTFDTDYILVHEPDFDAAVDALTNAGHVVRCSGALRRGLGSARAAPDESSWRPSRMSAERLRLRAYDACRPGLRMSESR